MSLIGSIVLADGQTTPVNHTFNVQQLESDGSVLLENRVGGIPLGYERLNLHARRRGTQAGSLDNKYVLTLALPTLEVTSPSTTTGIQPVPTLAFTDLAEVKFMSSARSNAVNRKNLVVMLRALLAKAEIENSIANGEGFWV